MCGVINTHPFGHCAGCRCFEGQSWTTSTPLVTVTTPYLPKHRKPGPAR